MRLAIVLCVFVALPVASAVTCPDSWIKSMMYFIGRMKYHSDLTLNDACDKESKKAVLEYMIDTLEILAMRLEMPCSFTFQPNPFSSNCAPLANNSGFRDDVNRVNSVLNSTCDVGSECSMEQEVTDEATEKVNNLANQLKEILSSL
ncbi:hypothetical protein L596_008921 [Steinernema carpocapsae]|uniref:Uncharacterized protein n=1 Tax=Steinernema carpocapsae TaxID=34508 RepID=A0A4U5PE41_STECR|nr:hypothetical protein L596_008921 [Steinernema carpocapsae]